MESKTAVYLQTWAAGPEFVTEAKGKRVGITGTWGLKQAHHVRQGAPIGRLRKIKSVATAADLDHGALAAPLEGTSGLRRPCGLQHLKTAPKPIGLCLVTIELQHVRQGMEL